MPTVPFRGLAERGILKDPSPYDLPPNAWSGGSNVIFQSTKAMRSPVFRAAQDPLTDHPAFVVGLPQSTGFDKVAYAGTTGRLYSIFGGVETEVSPTGIHHLTPVLAGTGYASTPPTVTIAGPGGGGVTATATAVLDGTGDHVVSYTITNTGSGYTGVPLVTVGGAATATAKREFVAASVTGTFTSAFLGDVTYVNNPSQGLYYLGPAGGLFHKDRQWDPTWTAAVFRVYKDYPIALNVTKGASTNTTLVKWGDTTLAGLTTTSWDSTDPTTNAGETPISDLTGPILDGLVMRDIFVIYSAEQVWEMVTSQDTFIFQFRRLFSEGGIIGTNCVAEVAGKHYVFGQNDIYVHDGVGKQSLLDKRNREWVYRHLNRSVVSRCFVQHFPALHAVLFAYVSVDDDAIYKSPTAGCNKGLIYNYADDTMGFVDLPNVTSMSLANLNSVWLWNTLPAALTWGNTGGTWADQSDSYSRSPVAVSCTLSGLVSADRLLGYDFLDKGNLAFPATAELNPPAFLERVGLDLDEQGAGLSTYKTVNRIYPQLNIFRGVTATITVGASLFPSGNISWATPVTYDPSTQYKVDLRKGGRYVAYRISVSSPADFEATGFDAEFVSGGSR